MSYAIRDLTSADLSEFIRLRKIGLAEAPSAFGESLEEFSSASQEEVQQRLEAQWSAGGFAIGAFDDRSKLCGVVCLAPMWGAKTAHKAMVWGMFVESSARGEALGEKLMATLIERSRSQKASDGGKFAQLHLAVVTANVPALRLYQRVGFSIYGTEPRALRIGEQYFDEHLLVKIL